MKALYRIYYRIFPMYRRLELKFVHWYEGDRLIRGNLGKPESEQWVIAEEENTNRVIGMVYLERRERIWE